MEALTEHDRKVLRNSPLLRTLTEDTFEAFLAISEKRSLQTNYKLLTEAERSDDFFIIISGKVNLYKQHNLKSKPQLIGLLGEGQTLGEMRVIRKRPCSLTVIAAEPLMVLHTSINTLHAKENRPCYDAILESIVAILTERLAATNQSVATKITERKRKTKQLLFAVFFICVLGFFLLEISFALYYAMNMDSMCNTVHSLQNGAPAQMSP